MVSVGIETIGIKEVLVDIGELARQLDSDDLGRVYHIGAIGPSGGDYAPLVQSKAHQAAIHRGYWQTDQDVIDRRDADIREEFEEVVQATAVGGRMNIRAAVERSLKLLHSDLTEYPPQRGYVRTGRQKRGWRWQVT